MTPTRSRTFRVAALVATLLLSGGGLLHGQQPSQGQLRLPADAVLRRTMVPPTAYSALYSGTIIWKISEDPTAFTQLNITVTNGVAYCDGVNKNGEVDPDYPQTTGSHKILGRGRLDLSLGLSTHERDGQNRVDLTDQYQFEVHCPYPEGWPSVIDPVLDMRLYVDSYKQPGGRITVDGGRIQAPERLAGSWSSTPASGVGVEQLSWYLCQQAPCAPPPPLGQPARF